MCEVRVLRLVRRQHRALRGEQRERGEADEAEDRERRAPAERGAGAVDDDRRDGVTQVAADAVRAVGVAKPLRRDVRVQDREVGRMEDAVADPHQRGDRIKPGDRRREPGEKCAAGQEPEAAQQHGTRAEAVDREAGGELRRATREIEGTGQRAQRRERDVELRPEQREHRRQHELEEVRQPVPEADQPDDLDVVAKRVCGGRIQGESGGLR